MRMMKLQLMLKICDTGIEYLERKYNSTRCHEVPARGENTVISVPTTNVRMVLLTRLPTYLPAGVFCCQQRKNEK